MSTSPKSRKIMTSACSVRLWPHSHLNMDLSVYTPTWHRVLLSGKKSGFFIQYESRLKLLYRRVGLKLPCWWLTSVSDFLRSLSFFYMIYLNMYGQNLCTSRKVRRKRVAVQEKKKKLNIILGSAKKYSRNWLKVTLLTSTNNSPALNTPLLFAAL